MRSERNPQLIPALKHFVDLTHSAYQDAKDCVYDEMGAFIKGDYEAQWEWFGPDWDDLNNRDTSGVAFIKGDGLSEEASGYLDDFIDGLAGGDIEMFVGPLNYQDGSVYLGDGEEATDFQLWYTEQLLEGMIGASAPS